MALEFSVKPSVDAKRLNEDESKQQQIKKWIMIGVATFVLALIVTGIILAVTWNTPEEPKMKSVSVKNGTPSEQSVKEPVGQSVKVASGVRVASKAASATANMTPLQATLYRLKQVVLLHWKIILPVSILVIALLVGGIVTAVVLSEQSRVVSEELAQELSVDDDQIMESQLSLFEIGGILLSTHFVLAILTAFSAHFWFPNFPLSKVIPVTLIILLTGHSFLFAFLMVHLFINFIADYGGDRITPLPLMLRIVGCVVFPIYLLLVLISLPFLLIVGDCLELLPAEMEGGVPIKTTKAIFNTINYAQCRLF